MTESPELKRTVAACSRTYGRYPNVVGVGTGLKYEAGYTQATICIQFYVRRKQKRISKGRLPRFVFGRTRLGHVNRSRRFPTDVIELRKLQFACKAGEQIEAIGEIGTLTLLFRNKAPSDSHYYMLTCAHVAGDVRQSPPIDPALRSGCCNSKSLFAQTIANSVHEGGLLRYDVALGEIVPDCVPQTELEVIGSGQPIRAFYPGDQIHAGMSVSCAFPVSNIVSGLVASNRIALPLQLDGQEYRVSNLFLIDRGPMPGDSGGLVYDGPDAVGILVGLADGWGLFQSLDEAFAHLRTISPVPIECF